MFKSSQLLLMLALGTAHYPIALADNNQTGPALSVHGSNTHTGAALSVEDDNVLVPVGSQGAAYSGVDRPYRGMYGDEVLDRFGKPISTTNSVGEPPITVWNYEHYSVYFEYDRVIHSVLLQPQG